MLIAYRLNCKNVFDGALIENKAESYGYMYREYGQIWIKSDCITDFIKLAKDEIGDFNIERVTIDNSRATFVKFVNYENLKLN